MKLSDTAISGVVLVSPEMHEDERGGFGRLVDARTFAARGLDVTFVQCSTSYNKRAGTLRGMHYQAAPHEEVKLVRCTMGAIYDVVLDLRRDSPTYLRWIGVQLDARNRRALYIPRGVAHGFQTLTNDAEVFYQIATEFEPSSARGVRWDDPAFAIEWPSATRTMSERDRAYPDYVR